MPMKTIAIVDRDATIARKADLLLHIRPILPFNLAALLASSAKTSSRPEVTYTIPSQTIGAVSTGSLPGSLNVQATFI